MLPQEFLRQIRRLHLRARRAVEDLLGGEYHSIFKGNGIAFEEVRAYQPGDDVRAIDWNVTARMGQPFIKRFVEDRELTVLLLFDCSGSQDFGTTFQKKRDIAGELAAILAFTAVSNNDRVGLIHFSDRKELYIPPRKGTRHILRLIREVLFFRPKHTGTDLQAGLDYANKILNRRAVIFLFSDFLDDGYQAAFKRTAKRHDLIAVRLADRTETSLPVHCRMRIEDTESGQQVLISANSTRKKAQYESEAQTRLESLRKLARSCKVDLVETDTRGNHLEALVDFFKLRDRRLKHR